MTAKVQTVDYFYMTVPDKPGAACHVLFQLAAADVNLHAFSAVPIGPENTQLVLFPENIDALARGAEKAGFVLSGPNRAFLVRGDDQLGALVGIHEKLSEFGINVYASTGVADGKGGFGYVMYVKGDQFDDAVRALGL
jgi:hypothetical protein